MEREVCATKSETWECLCHEWAVLIPRHCLWERQDGVAGGSFINECASLKVSRPWEALSPGRVWIFD